MSWWQRCPCGKGYTRCQEYIDPRGLSKDGWVNGFDEIHRAAGEEITVGVKTRPHIGIQLPAWSEAQRPATGKNDADESQ